MFHSAKETLGHPPVARPGTVAQWQAFGGRHSPKKCHGDTTRRKGIKCVVRWQTTPGNWLCGLLVVQTGSRGHGTNLFGKEGVRAQVVPTRYQHLLHMHQTVVQYTSWNLCVVSRKEATWGSQSSTSRYQRSHGQ